MQGKEAIITLKNEINQSEITKHLGVVQQTSRYILIKEEPREHQKNLKDHRR